MQLYPAIIAIYSHLFGQATLRTNYKLNPNKRERLLICKFIKFCQSTYSKQQLQQDFLIGYFEFQFSRYSGIKTPHGKNNIMLNWLIGEKAINEWQKRNIKKRYYVKWRCNKDFKLTLNQAFKKEFKVNRFSFGEVVNGYEE